MKFLSGILKSKITIFLFLLFLFYHSLFNTVTGQFLFDSLHPRFHSGSLSGDVTRFSFLSGIEVENLILKEKESSSQPFLSLSRLAFIYSLPSLLLGRLEIKEIGIESLSISIKKKGSRFNFEDIFPNSDVREEEIETQSNSDFIYTAIYIQFISYIHLENLNLTYEDEEMKTSIRDLSLRFLLKTKRINTIYFDQRSLDHIKSLSLEIQPSKTFLMEFENKILSFQHQIGFHFVLQTKGDDSEEWNQSLNFSLKDLTPMNSQIPQSPLNLEFSISSVLAQSKLQINEFLFVFQNQKFLEGIGNIDNIFDLKSKISFHLLHSTIDLDSIHRFLKPFQLQIPSLSGKLRLAPLEVSGTLENFKISWSPEFSNVKIQVDQKNHTLSSRIFQTHVQMGIIEERTEKKLQFLEGSIQIEDLQYNSLLLYSQIQYRNKILLGTLDIRDVNLNQFEKSIQGILGVKLKFKESSLSNISFLLNGTIKNFQIPIDSTHLKPSNIIFHTDTNLNLNESYQLLNIILMNTDIDLQSYRFGSTLKLESKKISYDNRNKNLNLEKSLLKIYPEKMASILPYSLGEKLTTISPYLGKEVSILSNINFELINQMQLSGEVESKIPGIQLQDLRTKLKISLNSDGKDTIHIQEIQLNGFEERFGSTLSGKIYKNNGKPIPDLSFILHLQSDSHKSLFSGVKFKGKLESQLKIKESILYGNFVSENFYFSYQKDDCSGKDCKYLHVMNLNCSIPILHDLGLKRKDSILDGNKETLIQTKGMEKRNNFFIESISTNHPIYPETSFTIVQGDSKNLGFTARIDYISNLFSLSNLSVKTLNGSIGSKDIQVNLSDGDPAHFEFLGNLQVRDIDLTELIPKENKKNIDDGKIRGDVNFSGRNLRDLIDNTDIYFSVYKIGKDFGKSAINIVSPPNLIRDYIVSSYSVDRIESELTKGLIYVNILFKPSLLSNLLTKIENNKISMERMPLSNFMNRAENEISKYK